MGCCCCRPLDPDESLMIDGCTSKKIVQGPGWAFYHPFVRISLWRKITLAADEYIVVKHLLHKNKDIENIDRHVSVSHRIDDADSKEEDHHNDIIEHISGPTTYKINDPFSEISAILKKKNLTIDDYVVVKNQRNGKMKSIEGPTLYMPNPYEELSEVKKKISLYPNEYVHITNIATGQIVLQVGPKTFALQPTETATEKFKHTTLNVNEYIYVTDKTTGQIVTHVGPKTFALQPTEIKDVINKKLS